MRHSRPQLGFTAVRALEHANDILIVVNHVTNQVLSVDTRQSYKSTHKVRKNQVMTATDASFAVKHVISPYKVHQIQVLMTIDATFAVKIRH